MPTPFNLAVLLGLIGFLFLVAPPLVARSKGFRWWPWVVPSGLLGFLAVLLLPSAREPGLVTGERVRRIQHGNWVGVAQAVIGGAGAAVAVIRAAL